MSLQYVMKSTLGPLYLVASDKFLEGVFWKKQNVEITSSPTPLLKRTILEIEEYLRGERQKFEVPLDARGTPFQQRVWAELRKIPYGKTLSYRQLAERVGNKKACRAVGSANGKNPISIIVPCHRVIAADGTLGGFAGGLPTKSSLLDLERGNI